MTKLLSPRGQRKTPGVHSQPADSPIKDAKSMNFSPAQSMSLNLDSLQELFESPLSPFTADSSPMVSPLSMSSDSQDSGYRSSSKSRAGRRTRLSNLSFSGNSTSSADPADLPVITLLLGAFKKTSLTCKAGINDVGSMDIGWPTNVRHVAHVTFDRYHGFLGLPVEFEMEVPRRVPSASASVFGVSAESMQCSIDRNGNSVPTILLLLQQRLYEQGGLEAEGIFRINAENSQEEHLRDQLNKGVVPHDIDVHCLAGLIKAWFRELPRGVLDTLTPEQVMQCRTEGEYLQLVRTLPQTQGALLNWAVNLMADVVQKEVYNKMNSRNIAMVFAPNMAQMSDPLTALMHAVQVMNLLKTLIQRVIKDREEAIINSMASSSYWSNQSELTFKTSFGEANETPTRPMIDCETFEEYMSARCSEDTMSRYQTTTEITEEDDATFDSSRDTAESADDNAASFNQTKNIKSNSEQGIKDGESPSLTADLFQYLTKAHQLLNGKQKAKTDKQSRG